MGKFIKENFKLVVIILIIAGIAIYFYSSKNSLTVKGTQALAIENKGLIEFNAENDTPNTVLPQDKKVAEEMLPVLKLMGDGKDVEKNKETVTALDKVIKKYPEYSDAYVLRAMTSLLSNDTDYKKMLSNIDNAIKLHASSKYTSAYDSTQGMYSLRAKIDFLSGDYKQTLDDLETAVRVNLTNASEVFNTGGVKPEDNSNNTVIQEKDLNILITQYPNDYRPYMFRGVFEGFFAKFDEKYYNQEISDLRTALKINPQSALVNYLLGKTAQSMSFWTKSAWADTSNLTGAKSGFRDQVNQIALIYFQEAIKLDSNFTDAYADVAQSFYSLKKYSDAIPYYDKVIELNPNNAGAYNDRGLSKGYINDSYGAISDFSDAIKLKKTNASSMGYSYENRANAYIKTNNYDSAIEDYSRAIGLKFASLVFLASIPEIRTLYPEFSNINDADLLEGLRQKYFSNMSSADFVGNYQHDLVNKSEDKKPYKDFVIGDLYTSRGDAYILKGDFKNASKDYNRAIYEGSTSIGDRWRPVSKTPSFQYFIDAQTIDFSQGNIVSLWLKTVTVSTGNYDQSKYQIDCSGGKLKLISSVSYDSLGNSTGTVSEQDWQIVTPDSVGETWYKGACQK